LVIRLVVHSFLILIMHLWLNVVLKKSCSMYWYPDGLKVRKSFCKCSKFVDLDCSNDFDFVG
jgi:hypothetical protein